MKDLEQEIEENYVAFLQSYEGSLQETARVLKSRPKKYLESYRMMVTLNAWQSELLGSLVHEDALAFIVEARNDALTSHVLASFGSWRSALKSLRSCIENTLFALYYKDHPVELQLWNIGKHRISFSDLMAYFRGHPAIAKIPENVVGLDLISDQYGTLSRAVHGSSPDFRMSVNGETVQLWSSDQAKLGKWLKNQRDVLLGINRLMMGLFREELQDLRLPNLRRAISLIIQPKHHPSIKRYFGITLYP